MKNPDMRSKSGFILFYVMGTAALLSLAAMIAIRSANLESRTARNHLDTTRALYHAEAGVKLVQRAVENRLMNGESLEDILDDLVVSPPTGITFDTIDTFRSIVPGRLFSFESVGRSNEAMASVVVHFRRRPLLQAGLFGVDNVTTRANVKIFGYDSRVLLDPSPADSNGGASVGSNGSLVMGTNTIIDGIILLGETDSGLIAGCNNCTSYTQIEVGHQDPDPLGLLDGGSMGQIFANKIVSNDNDTATGVIVNNQINGSGNMVLTHGDYYLTGVYLGPNTTLTIDDRDGPVRLFLDGSFIMQPNSDLSVVSKMPFGFQIYSIADEGITLRPNGDSESYVYAPDAHLFVLPGNNAKGAFWARLVTIQPPGSGGHIFLDTSLSERMLMNNLEIHAWYEQHVN